MLTKLHLDLLSTEKEKLAFLFVQARRDVGGDSRDDVMINVDAI